ncbi:growth factor receptor-bound protein 14 isoform X2 [Lingula anatina]|uniref:Growth factor receptor-bound protein 14 isoform X2 n=1 Tax=Lingula anatina TaxID=7574 RepID=A0A1S3JC13_LINAN|nr:growth factor receptor-bound protein 14 isoform X2 [Lingula anatina]|eukprot:XP_013407727.1 growth factor receptor-bound protein 14 isoform X2 [Lingula anatina]
MPSASCRRISLGNQGIKRHMSLPIKERTVNPFPELVESPVLPSSAYINNVISGSSPRSGMESPLLGGSSQSSSRSMTPPHHKNSEMETEWRGQLLRTASERLAGKAVQRKVLLNIYNQDSSYKTVPINEYSNVWDLCYLLVMKNHAMEDKNWMLVEHLTKLNLERGLEDHELILPLYDQWKNNENNKFYFRKDFRKYDLFQNPAQYYPDHLVDTEEDLVGISKKAEIQKKMLLQNLFSESDRVPDMQGFLHVKDAGKKSWKKMFFLLRGSGLYYSTKGTSKDPRHLVTFSQLTDCNVYLCLSAKKTFHAPTDFAFCLKPSEDVEDPKDLKCLCAEDEKSRIRWVAGLRFVKFGSKLRENYKTAMRREEKAKLAENGHGLPGQKNDVKSRVAMDFTGHKGRVIDDPNEAIGVAIEEGQHWRRKIARPSSSPRMPCTPVTASSPTAFHHHAFVRTGSSPPSDTMHNQTKTVSYGITSGVHMTQPWFHSGVTRDEAVAAIMKHGCIDGVYLVRESHKIPGVYVLSFAHNQKVRHYQISPLEHEGQLYYTLDEGRTKFLDLIQLVEFYKVNAAGLPTPLTHYVTELV